MPIIGSCRLDGGTVVDRKFNGVLLVLFPSAVMVGDRNSSWCWNYFSAAMYDVSPFHLSQAIRKSTCIRIGLRWVCVRHTRKLACTILPFERIWDS
jgi:hypothetical protein